MKRSSPWLSRRDLFACLIGAHASLWLGCNRPKASFGGQLLSPDFATGHRIRDRLLTAEPPSTREQVDVLIVGGGIAGLSAAWRLKQAGAGRVVLLEIDSVPGGTSRGEREGEFAFPWGAHYVPTPLKHQRGLIALLKEMEVVIGEHADGEPKVAEQYLCRDPQERVFVEGEWVEGIYPIIGASEEDLRQLQEFRGIIDEWIDRRDEQGRRMFSIPIATCSDIEEVRSLDRMTMGQWMSEKGFDSPRLRWLVDYSCRDDYGLSIDETSAWAGVFYFASRGKDANESTQDVITWPEGNARVVDYLVSRNAEEIRCSHAVYRIESERVGGHDVSRIDVWDTASERVIGFEAKHVVFAAPQFVAPHVIQGYRESEGREPSAFQYGSWLVANVHLRDRPVEAESTMCWDNVIYESKSLGYVSAGHQAGNDYGPAVLTWYYPLVDQPGAVSREQLLSLRWEDWAEMIVADLSAAHRDIDQRIERLDIMRWGHAMIQPRPGFIWSDARRQAAKPFANVHFANTDLSGVALLEEAFYHGVRAAEEILAAQGREVESIL